MKILRTILPVILIAVGATASVQAGPGVDYFKRTEAVSASAKAAREMAAQAPLLKCKITEVVRITPGIHGVPVRQVVSTNMDCSSCSDSSMACCVGKAKS